MPLPKQLLEETIQLALWLPKIRIYHGGETWQTVGMVTGAARKELPSYLKAGNKE